MRNLPIVEIQIEYGVVPVVSEEAYVWPQVD
jgi:hypothetical protein